MWALALFALGAVARGEMPLVALDFDVEVAGPLAEVVVHQTFRNDSDRFVEATYLFPLHPDAAVDGVEIHIGDRVIQATIAEKEAARQAYQQAVDEGRLASLTESRGPDLFTQHVGNIPPHSEVIIELRLVQPLDRHEGQWELVVPLTHTPRFALDGADLPDTTWVETDDEGLPRVSVEVHAVTGVPIHEASSPSHPMHIQRWGPELLASLDSVPPGRDLVLRWRTATDEAVVGFLVAGDHGLLTLEPPRQSRFEERVPRELIWVVDQSGSMSGAPLELTKRAMLAALDLLDERDSFTVIGFSKSLRAWSDGPVPATLGNRQRAAAWVNDLVASGGTRLDRAVSAALAMPGDLGRQRVITFVTDGAITFEQAVYDEIIAADTDATLVTVGIGSAPNRGLLDELADLGGGRSVVLPLDADVGPAMAALMAALDRPVLTGARLDWAEWEPQEVWPRRLPDLRVDEPTYVVVRMGGQDGGPVWLDGNIGPDRVQRVLYPQFVDAERALRSTFGRAKVDDLYRRALRGGVDDVDAKVLAIALEYAIVTPVTSFVAIEKQVTRNPGGDRDVRTSQSATPFGVTRGPLTVDSASRGQVLTKEFLERVPSGRSYQSAVQMAAGMTGGGGNPNMAGGATNENTYMLDGANITDPVTGTFSLYWDTTGVVTLASVLPSPSWGLAAALHPARPGSSLGRVAASRTHFGTVAGGQGAASELLASTHLLLGSHAHGSALASVQEAAGRSQRVVGTGMLAVQASGGQAFSAFVGGDRGWVDGQPFGGGNVAVRADVMGDSTNTHVAWQGAHTRQLDDGSSLSTQEGSAALQLETGDAAFTLGGAYDHRIWAETDGFDLERGLLGTGFARWDQKHEWFTLTTGLTHHAFANNPLPAPMGSLMLHAFDYTVHLFVGGARRWSVGRWLPPSLIDAAGAAHTDTLRYGINIPGSTLSALAAVQHEVVQHPWVALLPSGAPVFGLDRVRGDLDRAERRRIFAEGFLGANTTNQAARVQVGGWVALRSSGDDRLADPTAAFVPYWVDGLRPGGASIEGTWALPLTLAPVLSASAGWSAAVPEAPEAWWTRDRWQLEALIHQPIDTRGLDAGIDLGATWNRGTAFGSPLPVEFLALDPLAIGDLAPFRVRAALEVRF